MLLQRINEAVELAMEQYRSSGDHNNKSSVVGSQSNYKYSPGSSIKISPGSNKKPRPEEDDSFTDDFDEEFSFPSGFSMSDHELATDAHQVIKVNRDFWFFHIFTYFCTNRKITTHCNWMPVFEYEPFKTGFDRFCGDPKAAAATRMIIGGKSQDIVKLSVYTGWTMDQILDNLKSKYYNKYK